MPFLINNLDKYSKFDNDDFPIKYKTRIILVNVCKSKWSKCYPDLILAGWFHLLLDTMKPVNYYPSEIDHMVGLIVPIILNMLDGFMDKQDEGKQTCPKIKQVETTNQLRILLSTLQSIQEIPKYNEILLTNSAFERIMTRISEQVAETEMYSLAIDILHRHLQVTTTTTTVNTSIQV